MKKLHLFDILTVAALLVLNSCKKDSNTSGPVYVPSISDVTANATLAELQQGHTIYISSCGACHGLYSPDSFSKSGWSSVLANMAPRAGLSSAQTALVLKYVSRGQ